LASNSQTCQKEDGKSVPFFFFLRMEQAKEGVAFKEKEGQRRKLQLGHKDKSSTKNGHLLKLLSH